MAGHCTTSFIYLMILMIVPVLSAKSEYIEFGLDYPRICNPSSDKISSLDELRKKDSAIKILPSHVFTNWRNILYNKHCKFKVKATKGDGLFAVIQRMSFRRNGSECLDYIRFTPETGMTSEKYCGKLDHYNGMKRYIPTITLADYEMQNPDYQNSVDFSGMFEAYSPYSKITTEIFISRQPLQPGESLDLEVIYTPYKDCKYSEAPSQFWSGPPYNCINSKYICDGNANCASLICSDESNCTSVVNRIISDGTGTKVTISAVTTIFLCFIIFVLCMWICRKHRKLCWSPDCAGPPTTVTGSVSGLPMERGEQSAPHPPYVPTAPMLEVAVSAPLHDKDLPPSYDSLFPSQTNAANP